MADRRIKDLTPQLSLDTAFRIAVDKAGQTEATSVALSELTSVASGVKVGSASLLADDVESITFSSPFVALTYVLITQAVDGDGNPVAVNVTSRGLSAFKVLAAADCTLEYIAAAI